MASLLRMRMPDKPVDPLPPAFTLPRCIDPADEASVKAFMESATNAWRDCMAQRRADGLCLDCGHPIDDPQFGCTNVKEDCLEALLAERRREASRR